MTQSLPPAMRRHLDDRLKGHRPRRWPVLVFVIAASTALSFGWTWIGLPTNLPVLLARTAFCSLLTFLVARWSWRRYLRRNPLPSPEQLAREMLESWVRANRDAAPWN